MALHRQEEEPNEPAGNDPRRGLFEDELPEEEEIFGEPDLAAAEPAVGVEPDAVAAAPAMELQSLSPAPTTPAAEPEASPPAAEVAHATSTSHTKQWKLLDRVAKGPRAKQFPTITELWKGDSASKQRALRMYLQHHESLETAESKLVVEKRHDETVTHRRAWLTIAQMKEKGMSQKLVCVNYSLDDFW